MQPQHIVTFDEHGWEVIHTLACPQNLLECPVTILCMDLDAPPRTGRFWAGIAQARGGGPWRIDFGAECPDVVRGTSRVTRSHFGSRQRRPGERR